MGTVAATDSICCFIATSFAASLSAVAGPPGANLFIYHLPPHVRDLDLRSMFATYGVVLSAKVFTDRRTEESKGFGGASLSQLIATRSTCSYRPSPPPAQVS